MSHTMFQGHSPCSTNLPCRRPTLTACQPSENDATAEGSRSPSGPEANDAEGGGGGGSNSGLGFSISILHCETF
jgi:hypothetical protein